MTAITYKATTGTWESKFTGIEVRYRRISPEKFTELQSNPEIADEFFYGDAAFDGTISVYQDDLIATGSHLSIHKEWQAIHYLLTGEVAWDDQNQVEPPLRNVVMGGTPTEFEAGYGYVRYLTPDEVKEVTGALGQIPQDSLRERFDGRGNTKLYTQHEWNEEIWAALMHTYAHLVKFFNEAAAQGEAILVSAN